MRQKMNRYAKIVMLLITIVCIMIALFADVKSTGNLSMALNGTGVTQFLMSFLIGIIVYNFCRKQRSESFTSREKVFYSLFAGIFALFMIIGKGQEAHEDLKYFYIAIPMSIGWFALFWGIAVIADRYLHKIKIPFTGGKWSEIVFEKHPILASMMIVWFFRMIWLIAFFPCTTSWDGAIQIRNFYGREIFTNHHPPLISFFYGNIAWYSNQLGIDNLGMFMIPVIQVLLSSFAVANVSKLMKQLHTPYWMRWGSLLYFSAFSVWCIYDCTIIKDTLYYPFVMLFGIKVIECLTDEESFWKNKKNLVLLVCYGVVMTQIRNNGIFVLIFTLPFLCFVVKRTRKVIMAGLLLSSLLCIWILENNIYPVFGVINLESKVDTYCILFQQTAKYSIEHPDDVTEEERMVLNQLFDYDELANVYNPYLADWVKNCLRIQEGAEEDPTNHIFAELKSEYIKVWFAQGCRHPWTYLKAFFECSYGYYYPELRVYKEGYGHYELSHDLLTNRMSDISQIDSLSKVRFLLEQIGKLEYVPGIGMLYRCGFYTWVLMGIMLLQWKNRHYKALIACIPAAVNVLVCLISPVNTCIRYAMPTMCLIPILLAWTVYQYEFVRK